MKVNSVCFEPSMSESKIQVFITQKKEKAILHGWVKELLTTCLRKPLDEDDFLKEEFGKPFLRNYPLHYNLSHSHDYAIMALSTKVPVGIDIEKIRSNLNVEKLTQRFFTPAESLWVKNDPEKFFRLWVRKEAFLKCLGRGLSLGLNKVEVLEDTISYDERVWKIADIVLDDADYRAAICQCYFS